MPRLPQLVRQASFLGGGCLIYRWPRFSIRAKCCEGFRLFGHARRQKAVEFKQQPRVSGSR